VKHFDENDAKLDAVEVKEMQTTVFEKLEYLVRPNVRHLDTYLRKESGNQHAVADIVVDDVTIASGVPGNVLLGLETKLAELRTVYEAAPTLPPGPVWEADTSTKAFGVHRSRFPELRSRTRKTIRAVELSPATPQHPAQVQAVPEDVPIARITQETWSGMLSSLEKSLLLERIDKLIRACKRGRQRANGVDAPEKKIGDALFAFIHKDIVRT
jgi:hypothetical protein